ncbi:MAG: DUF1553 domain-containing protein [Gemmataceae bacterium]|nr:DUF1553 domain-containing protein [Gemmataceae bacterium]
MGGVCEFMGKTMLCRAIFAVTLLALALTMAGLAQEPVDKKKPFSVKPHWAFQSVKRPQVPQVKIRAESDIDRFIVAALEAKGQNFNGEADRPTLIRRISFDLTGLPPSLSDIDAFLADVAPKAYERMVDRYLASPHYGERWGKYWLDTAGYADSNGYFNADSDRPHAWRYRDYVIRAFNADKPFDRFIQEQLAGDELAGYKPGSDLTPEMAELLTATHFLRNAPDGTGESDGNPDEVRIDRYTVLEGTLQITMNSLLGVTIQCARCHSHKFEPISHKDYYQLQAIFFPAYNPERWKQPKDRIVEVVTQKERDEWKRQNDLVDQHLKTMSSRLAIYERSYRDQLLRERLKDLAVPLQDKIIEAVNAQVKARTKEQSELLKMHAKAPISVEELAKQFPDFAEMREQFKKSSATREKDRPKPLAKLSVFVETDASPPVHHVLKRGQHNQPGGAVEPGVPGAFTTLNNAYRLEQRPPGQISTGRRLALARWITSAENPLFARVMVNRIWQHHFGAGLSATPDNLGQSGARPSHPELLDYLASEFVKSGWSVKAMHRAILRSAVYRQSSAPREDLNKIDPDNPLLGRFPLRRLDAEAVRDALLSAAGELDTRAGGSYIPSRRTKEGTVEIPENHEGAKRRSVYLQQRRTQVVTLLQLFDAPSIVSNCSMRTTSTVPLQSLALLNSKFVRDRAKSLEQRLTKEAGAETATRLNLTFRLACGRPPNAEETAAVERFLIAQRKAYAGAKDGEQRAWTDLCQMVLASNAFLYVE